MKQEIIIEDAFRTDNVDGAIVTAMGIVAREKDGGLSAFIDVDDEKGLLTYNLMVKGDVAGIPDAKDIKKWRIPGYLDFSKFNKALIEHGFIPYIDLENNSWETEPPLVGKTVWIERIKTSTATDGKEYFSHIKIVKIEDGGQPKQQATPQATPKQPASPPATPSNDPGTESPVNLRDIWLDICMEVLAEKPHKETEIVTKVVKNKIIDEKIHEMLDNPSIRKQLADVRKTMLTSFVSESILEINDDGKYQLAV